MAQEVGDEAAGGCRMRRDAWRVFSRLLGALGERVAVHFGGLRVEHTKEGGGRAVWFRGTRILLGGEW